MVIPISLLNGFTPHDRRRRLEYLARWSKDNNEVPKVLIHGWVGSPTLDMEISTNDSESVAMHKFLEISTNLKRTRTKTLVIWPKPLVLLICIVNDEMVPHNLGI